MRLLLALLFAVALVAQEPGFPPEGGHPHDHPDGTPGAGCSQHPDVDSPNKCASETPCKVCEKDENGISLPREDTNCKSYCHKLCCHCPSPCDS